MLMALLSESHMQQLLVLQKRVLVWAPLLVHLLGPGCRDSMRVPWLAGRVHHSVVVLAAAAGAVES
jgi:hypothetical protein